MFLSVHFYGKLTQIQIHTTFSDPILLHIKWSWIYHSVIPHHLNSNEFTLLRTKCGNTGRYRKMIQTSKHQQFEWDGYIRILDIPSCRKILQTSRHEKFQWDNYIKKAFRFVKIDLQGAIDLVKRMSNEHDNRHLYSE